MEKYDKEWRIKLMMEPQEHQHLFPLFQPTDYQKDRKRVNFRYDDSYYFFSYKKDKDLPCLFYINNK